MSAPALKVDDLSKQFFLGDRLHNYSTLREALVNVVKAPVRRYLGKRDVVKTARAMWALDGVSFEVQPGEVVGIIGRNGAGKSTLLKILSRITEPTRGNAEIRGRLGSLLEVGTGFHPELTGRENIFFNGAVLGMKKREIDRHFDEIVAFAEVDKFLDTPVKRYSSGMTMRLAFAVAAHLNPEIMIIDEVLAVGDSAFQKKCLGKMSEKAHEGRTILFVSHNLSAVQSLCSRCLFLNQGKLVAEGDTMDVIQRYLNSVQGRERIDLSERQDRIGTQAIRFNELTLRRDDGTSTSTFLSGENVNVCMNYSMRQSLPADADIRFACTVYDLYDNSLFTCGNELTNQKNRNWAREGTVRCRIPRLPLPGGAYRIDVSVNVNVEVADLVHSAGNFSVESADYYATGKMLPSYTQGCRFLVPHDWHFEKAA